ncbi:MAG: hypothetical protein JXA37_02190 [Chloroflexia bacterium]|nr:hypothetical protein [Chloroflexia bacterium]
MAQRTAKDPWHQLCGRKGNVQVGLGDILPQLELKGRPAQELKKEILRRLREVAQER